jgi:hypothetical protein
MDDSLTQFHLITLSARDSTLGGIVQADLLGSLRIGYQVELSWLLDRQVVRLCSFQDSVHVIRGGR